MSPILRTESQYEKDSDELELKERKKVKNNLNKKSITAD